MELGGIPMRMIFDFILAVIKIILKIIVGCLWLILEALKIILLLFGMVCKVFLIFVHAGTPR